VAERFRLGSLVRGANADKYRLEIATPNWSCVWGVVAGSYHRFGLRRGDDGCADCVQVRRFWCLIKIALPTEFVSVTYKVAASGKYVTETLVDVMVGIISGEVEERFGESPFQSPYDIFRRLASGQTVTKLREQLQIGSRRSAPIVPVF